MVVGEVIEYVGVMTLPELTMASTISLTLANGLLVRDATVVEIGSRVNGSSLLVGGSGVSAGVTGGATRVDFDFGTVTNNFDDIADAKDKISVRVVAQVEDIVAVSSGVSLMTSGQAVADSLRELASPNIVVVAREPALEVLAPTFASNVEYDGGDIVEYNLTVRHTSASSADAYDISLVATVPDTLEVLASAEYDVNGANTTATWSVDTLSESAGSFEKTMRVRVRDFSMGNVDNGAMSRHEMYV